jgi:hypothetical protein
MDGPLSPDADAFTHARREAAEKIADQLPNAPKQPA